MWAELPVDNTAKSAQTAGIYRRTGATAPFGDLWKPHGGHFEGWFWRLTDSDRGRVVIALLSINRPKHGKPWATAGIASHPGGFSVSAALPDAWATSDAVGAGQNAHATRATLRLDLEGASIEIEIGSPRSWPLRTGGIGLAGALPGLSQYWHPWLLSGTVRGSAVIDGQHITLEGTNVYAEKNWGPDGFPKTWWWGQAHGFSHEDVGVAFAGGRAGVGRLGVTAGAAIAWTGSDLRRVVRPLQRMSIEVGSSGWRLRGGDIEIEGESNGSPPHLLPVPLTEQRRNLDDAAHQHLAARLRLKIGRRGGTVFEGVSTLAGLERGEAK